MRAQVSQRLVEPLLVGVGLRIGQHTGCGVHDPGGHTASPRLRLRQLDGCQVSSVGDPPARGSPLRQLRTEGPVPVPAYPRLLCPTERTAEQPGGGRPAGEPGADRRLHPRRRNRNRPRARWCRPPRAPCAASSAPATGCSTASPRGGAGGPAALGATGPAPAWQGVREATSRAALLPGHPQRPGLRPPVGEDCLNLNVWTPTGATPKNPARCWSGSTAAGSSTAAPTSTTPAG